MGSLGSTEKLGQFVAVYGYNNNEFPWKETVNRTVYHTTGIIVDHNNKKFVITTRTSLISCQNIIIYHGCTKNIRNIMKNELEIKFQSIEHNIIILVTKNCYEFDPNKSETLYSDNENMYEWSSVNLCDNLFPVPTVRSKYFSIRINIGFTLDKASFCVQIDNVKYLNSFVYDESYLPDDYLYKYSLENTDNCLKGINGAFIFNKKNKLVGMVTKSINNMLYVLPKKSMSKIFLDFIDYLDTPLEYHGLLSLPFKYQVNNNHVIIISNSNVRTSDGFIGVKKNDQVVSINDKNIFVKSKIAVIFDDDYQNNVPLHIYLKYAINKTPINMKILRRKKIVNLSIYGSNNISDDIPLTNQPFFSPIIYIPYVRLETIIICQLSHELMDICAYHSFFIRNDVINDYFESNNTVPKNIFLVIDCLDDVIAKKFSLPQLKINNVKTTLYCPVVTTINGNIISNLSDAMIAVEKKIKNMTLSLGMSYKNQYMISL